jgi:hypothetical protein
MTLTAIYPLCRQLRDVLFGDASSALVEADVRPLGHTLPPACLDAIITDPPYSVKTSWLYAAVHLVAARCLKPGGHLLMILPHWAMDPMQSRLGYAVPTSLVSEYHALKWRWLLDMMQTRGSYPRLPNRNRHLAVTHKPIGWWTKYPLLEVDRRGMLDSFDNDPPPAPKQKRHKWQQSETWANYCLDVLKPGALVWDPMMGGGTLPLVARRRGFRVIGSDVDSDAVAISRAALEREGLL